MLVMQNFLCNLAVSDGLFATVSSVDWFSKLDVRLSAAIIAAVVSLIVATFNSVFALLKYRSENTLSRQTERAIKRLIRHSDDPYVPFRQIQHHIGGYSEDELRKILVRCGALRFADTNMVERWALLSEMPQADRLTLFTLEISASKGTPPSRLFPLSSIGRNHSDDKL